MTVTKMLSSYLRWALRSVRGYAVGAVDTATVPPLAQFLDTQGLLYTHYPAGYVQTAAPSFWQWNDNFGMFTTPIAANAVNTDTRTFTTDRPYNLEIHSISDLTRNSIASGSTQQSVKDELSFDGTVLQTTTINFKNRSAATQEKRCLHVRGEVNSATIGGHTIQLKTTNGTGLPTVQRDFPCTLLVIGWPIGTTWDTRGQVLI